MSRLRFGLTIVLFSDSSVDGTLQVVQIYFDTPTYDEVERDVKVAFVLQFEMKFYKNLNHLWHLSFSFAPNQVTLESALGLIGGTMGLFTGFSILSGIEIVYYALKFSFSLRVKKEDVIIKKKHQPD